MIRTNEKFKRDLQERVVDPILNYQIPGDVDKKVDQFLLTLEKKYSAASTDEEREAIRNEWLNGLKDDQSILEAREQLKTDIEQLRSLEYEFAIYLSSSQRKQVHERIESLFRDILASCYGRGVFGGGHGAANAMLYGYNRLERIYTERNGEQDAKLQEIDREDKLNKIPWGKAHKAVYPNHPPGKTVVVKDPQAEAVLKECVAKGNQLMKERDARVDELTDLNYTADRIHVDVVDYYGWDWDIFKSPRGNTLIENNNNEGEPEIYTVDSLAARVCNADDGSEPVEGLKSRGFFSDVQLILKLALFFHMANQRDEHLRAPGEEDMLGEMRVPFNSIEEERVWFKDILQIRVPRCYSDYEFFRSMVDGDSQIQQMMEQAEQLREKDRMKWFDLQRKMDARRDELLKGRFDESEMPPRLVNLDALPEHLQHLISGGAKTE